MLASTNNSTCIDIDDGETNDNELNSKAANDLGGFSVYLKSVGNGTDHAFKDEGSGNVLTLNRVEGTEVENNIRSWS